MVLQLINPTNTSSSDDVNTTTTAPVWTDEFSSPNFFSLLVSLVIIILWFTYIAYYHSRVLGFLLTHFIRKFFKLNKLSIGSFSFSVLSGKVMVRDVKVITENFSLVIYDAWFIFRYWKPYIPRHDFMYDSSIPRIVCRLHGLELHVYNNMDEYRKMAKLFGLDLGNHFKYPPSEGPPKPKQTRSTNGTEASGTGTGSNDWTTQWRDLLSVIKVHVTTGRILFGNQVVPSTLALTFDNMDATYSVAPASNRHDPFMHLFDGRCEDFKASFVKSANFAGYYEPPPRIMGEGFLILSASDLKFKYKQDEPGNVLTDETPNVNNQRNDWCGSPVWSIDCTVGKSCEKEKRKAHTNAANISYGPWADKQRDALYKMFYPPNYQVVPITPYPELGEQRVFTKCNFSLKTDGKIGLELFFSKDETNRVIYFDCSSHSSFDVDIPMVTRHSGYRTAVNIHLSGVQVHTSLPLRDMVKADSCDIKLDLRYPKTWNGLQVWNMDFAIQKCTMSMIYMQKDFFQDLMNEWSDPNPPDLLHFVPYVWNFTFRLFGYELILCVNEHNWIDTSSAHDNENCRIALCGNNIDVEFCLPFLQFLPTTVALDFGFKAYHGMDVRLFLPDVYTSKEALGLLFSSAKVESHCGRRNNLVINDWGEATMDYYNCWHCDSGGRLNFSFKYHPSQPKTDCVSLRDLDSIRKFSLVDFEPTDLPPDQIAVDFELDGSDLSLTGELIKIFLDLKENYFGESQELIEYDSFKQQQLTAKVGMVTQTNFKAEHFRPLHVRVALRLKNLIVHCLSFNSKNDPHCPQLMAEEFAFEMDKRFLETKLQLILSPVVLHVSDSHTKPFSASNPNAEGQLMLTAFQMRGHAMFSNAELPVDAPTVEYGWLMEFVLGDLLGRLTFVHCIQISQFIDCFLLQVLNDEDKLPFPRTTEVCCHQVPRELCDRIRPDKKDSESNLKKHKNEVEVEPTAKLCRTEHELKYKMLRFSADKIDLYVVDSSMALQIDSGTIRLHHCGLHSELNSKGGVSLWVPRFFIRQFVLPEVLKCQSPINFARSPTTRLPSGGGSSHGQNRLSEGSSGARQASVISANSQTIKDFIGRSSRASWLETTSFDLGDFKLDIALPVHDSELHRAQRLFLTLHDTPTKRLFFLWKDEDIIIDLVGSNETFPRPADLTTVCGCLGGSKFFGNNHNGRTFTDPKLLDYPLATVFVSNDSDPTFGQSILRSMQTTLSPDVESPRRVSLNSTMAYSNVSARVEPESRPVAETVETVTVDNVRFRRSSAVAALVEAKQASIQTVSPPLSEIFYEAEQNPTFYREDEEYIHDTGSMASSDTYESTTEPDRISNVVGFETKTEQGGDDDLESSINLYNQLNRPIMTSSVLMLSYSKFLNGYGCDNWDIRPTLPKFVDEKCLNTPEVRGIYTTFVPRFNLIQSGINSATLVSTQSRFEKFSSFNQQNRYCDIDEHEGGVGGDFATKPKSDVSFKPSLQKLEINGRISNALRLFITPLGLEAIQKYLSAAEKKLTEPHLVHVVQKLLGFCSQSGHKQAIVTGFRKSMDGLQPSSPLQLYLHIPRVEVNIFQSGIVEKIVPLSTLAGNEIESLAPASILLGIVRDVSVQAFSVFRNGHGDISQLVASSPDEQQFDLVASVEMKHAFGQLMNLSDRHNALVGIMPESSKIPYTNNWSTLTAVSDYVYTVVMEMGITSDSMLTMDRRLANKAYTGSSSKPVPNISNLLIKRAPGVSSRSRYVNNLAASIGPAVINFGLCLPAEEVVDVMPLFDIFGPTLTAWIHVGHRFERFVSNLLEKNKEWKNKIMAYLLTEAIDYYFAVDLKPLRSKHDHVMAQRVKLQTCASCQLSLALLRYCAQSCDDLDAFSEHLSAVNVVYHEDWLRQGIIASLLRWREIMKENRVVDMTHISDHVKRIVQDIQDQYDRQKGGKVSVAQSNNSESGISGPNLQDASGDATHSGNASDDLSDLEASSPQALSDNDDSSLKHFKSIKLHNMSERRQLAFTSSVGTPVLTSDPMYSNAMQHARTTSLKMQSASVSGSHSTPQHQSPYSTARGPGSKSSTLESRVDAPKRVEKSDVLYYEMLDHQKSTEKPQASRKFGMQSKKPVEDEKIIDPSRIPLNIFFESIFNVYALGPADDAGNFIFELLGSKFISSFNMETLEIFVVEPRWVGLPNSRSMAHNQKSLFKMEGLQITADFKCKMNEPVAEARPDSGSNKKSRYVDIHNKKCDHCIRYKAHLNLIDFSFGYSTLSFFNQMLLVSKAIQDTLSELLAGERVEGKPFQITTPTTAKHHDGVGSAVETPAAAVKMRGFRSKSDSTSRYSLDPEKGILEYKLELGDMSGIEDWKAKNMLSWPIRFHDMLQTFQREEKRDPLRLIVDGSCFSGHRSHLTCNVFGVVDIMRIGIQAHLTELFVTASVCSVLLGHSSKERFLVTPHRIIQSSEQSVCSSLQSINIDLSENNSPINSRQLVLIVRVDPSQAQFTSVLKCLETPITNALYVEIGMVDVSIPLNPGLLHGVVVRSTKGLTETLKELKTPQVVENVIMTQQRAKNTVGHYSRQLDSVGSIAIVNFSFSLKSLVVNAALLPSLDANYKMGHVTSWGITGKGAQFVVEIQEHSIIFDVKKLAEESDKVIPTIELPIPPIRSEGCFRANDHSTATADRPSTSNADQYVIRDGDYLNMSINVGTFHHTLTTDLLNQLLFIQEAFVRELSEIVTKITTDRPPTTRLMSGRVGGSTPLLYALTVTWEKVEITATTPTATAVRLEAAKMKADISNRVWERKVVVNYDDDDADSKTEDRLDKVSATVELPLTVSLGQLVKEAMYEELETEFQVFAYFKTTIKMRNAPGSANDATEGNAYLISLNSPVILVLPTAVDKAILIWISYKNTYEFWNEQRQQIRMRSPPFPIQKVTQSFTASHSVLLEHIGSPGGSSSAPLFLQVKVEGGLYFCMPLTSAHYVGLRSVEDVSCALVVSLEDTSIAVMSHDSLVSSGSFRKFAVYFIEHFDSGEEDMRNQLDRSKTADVNICDVPNGTYKVCSKTTAPTNERQSAQWILNIMWEMQGIDITCNSHIGKLLSQLVNTLTSIAGDEEDSVFPVTADKADMSHLLNQHDSYDDVYMKQILIDINEAVRLTLNDVEESRRQEQGGTVSSKDRPTHRDLFELELQKRMNQQSSHVNDLVKRGANETLVEHQRAKVRAYEKIRSNQFRTQMKQVFKKQSMKASNFKNNFGLSYRASQPASRVRPSGHRRSDSLDARSLYAPQHVVGGDPQRRSIDPYLNSSSGMRYTNGRPHHRRGGSADAARVNTNVSKPIPESIESESPTSPLDPMAVTYPDSHDTGGLFRYDSRSTTPSEENYQMSTSGSKRTSTKFLSNETIYSESALTSPSSQDTATMVPDTPAKHAKSDGVMWRRPTDDSERSFRYPTDKRNLPKLVLPDSTESAPGGATTGASTTAAPNVDLYLDLKIHISSGHCVLKPDKDKDDENVNSNLTYVSRGANYGKVKEDPKVELYIPGVSVKSYYASQANPGDIVPPIGSTVNPYILRTANLPEEVVNHMVQSNKKAQFFMSMTLERMPHVTEISPLVLRYLEQTLEPLSGTEIKHQAVSPRPISTDDKKYSSEARNSSGVMTPNAAAPISDKAEPPSAFSLDLSAMGAGTFAVDVVVYFLMQSSEIVFTCQPISRVECKLKLPTLSLVATSRKSSDVLEFAKFDHPGQTVPSSPLQSNQSQPSSSTTTKEEFKFTFPETKQDVLTGGISVTVGISDFSLFIYHHFLQQKQTFDKKRGKDSKVVEEPRNSLKLDVQSVTVNISRCRNMVTLEDNDVIGVGPDTSSPASEKPNVPLKNSVRFSLIVDISKATFTYDMRRLHEILTFPKAWYNRAIMRRLFLGDEALDVVNPSGTSHSHTTDSTTHPDRGRRGSMFSGFTSVSAQGRKDHDRMAGGGNMSSRTALSSIDSDGDLIGDARKRRRSGSFGQQKAVTKTIGGWDALVLFAVNFSELDVDVNMDSTESAPGGATTGASTTAAPNVDLYLDLKIHISSGHCVLKPDKDKDDENVNSNLTYVSRGANYGKVKEDPKVELYIPGVSVKSYYASQANPGDIVPPIGSTVNPYILRTANLPEEVVNHMVQSNKKAQFFISMTLERMPHVTEISPLVLRYLEQTLEPLSGTEIKHQAVSPRYISKATFTYDMRRLHEILTFPKAWYNRAIMRRLFLGDEALDVVNPSGTSHSHTTDSTTHPDRGRRGSMFSGFTSVSAQGRKDHDRMAGGGNMSSRTALSSIDSDGDLIGDARKRRRSGSFGQQKAVTKTIGGWDALVLFAVNFSELDVDVNMGSSLGSIVWKTQAATSQGHVAVDSGRNKNVYLSFGLGSSKLTSTGGFVGGDIELNALNIYIGIKQSNNLDPRHTVGFDLGACELKIDWMGSTAFMWSVTSLSAALKDDWKIFSVPTPPRAASMSVEKETITDKRQLWINGDITWNRLQAMMSQTTVSDMQKVIAKVKTFFYQEFKSGKKLLQPTDLTFYVSSANKLASEQAKDEQRELDANSPRHHRHWQKCLELIVELQYIFKIALTIDSAILGGYLNFKGEDISLACFHGKSFPSAKKWAIFHLRKPAITFSTEACDIVKAGAIGTQASQELIFSLGHSGISVQDDRKVPMGLILTVTPGGPVVPPQYCSIKEWFMYTFGSVLHSIYGPGYEMDTVSSAKSILDGMKRRKSQAHQFHHYKHECYQVFNIPGMRFNLLTQHIQGPVAPEPESDDPALVNCSFVATFHDHLLISSEIENLVFLKDLIMSYIQGSKHDKPMDEMTKDGVEDPTEELAKDARLFVSNTWQFEPTVRFMNMDGNLWGVDKMLQKLGFQHARLTIPKWIQRGFNDPIDSVLAKVMELLIKMPAKGKEFDFEI